MDRLFASNARDGDTVLVASGGTAVRGNGAYTCMRTQTQRRALLDFQQHNKQEDNMDG
jgi:hypothetical protein